MSKPTMEQELLRKLYECQEKWKNFLRMENRMFIIK